MYYFIIKSIFFLVDVCYYYNVGYVNCIIVLMRVILEFFFIIFKFIVF